MARLYRTVQPLPRESQRRPNDARAANPPLPPSAPPTIASIAEQVRCCGVSVAATVDQALDRWKDAYLALPTDEQASFATKFRKMFPEEDEALCEAIPYGPRCKTLVRWLCKNGWKMHPLEVFAILGTRWETQLKECKIIAGMCSREKGMALVRGMPQKSTKSYKAVVAQLLAEGNVKPPTRPARNGLSKGSKAKGSKVNGTKDGDQTGQQEQVIEQSEQDGSEQSGEDDQDQSGEHSHDQSGEDGQEQSGEDDQEQSGEEDQEQSGECSQEQSDDEHSVERSVEKMRGRHGRDLTDVSTNVSRESTNLEGESTNIDRDNTNIDRDNTNIDGENTNLEIDDENTHLHGNGENTNNIDDDDDFTNIDDDDDFTNIDDDDDFTGHGGPGSDDDNGGGGGGGGDDELLNFDASPPPSKRARHLQPEKAFAPPSPTTYDKQSHHHLRQPLSHGSQPHSSSRSHATFADAQTRIEPSWFPHHTMSASATSSHHAGFKNAASSGSAKFTTATDAGNKRHRVDEDEPTPPDDNIAAKLAAVLQSLGVKDADTRISSEIDLNGDKIEKFATEWVFKGAVELFADDCSQPWHIHTPLLLNQHFQSSAWNNPDDVKKPEPSGDELTDAALLAVRSRVAKIEAEFQALRVAQDAQFGILEILRSTNSQTDGDTVEALQRQCEGYRTTIEQIGTSPDNPSLTLLKGALNDAQARVKTFQAQERKKKQLLDAVRGQHEAYSGAAMGVKKILSASTKREGEIAAVLRKE